VNHAQHGKLDLREGVAALQARDQGAIFISIGAVQVAPTSRATLEPEHRSVLPRRPVGRAGAVPSSAVSVIDMYSVALEHESSVSLAERPVRIV
jgi:hypothetical protein